MTSRAGQLSSLLTSTPLHGFRNKIINGNFDIWQRGTSLASTGFLADRWWWVADGTGGVAEMSRQPFLPGQADVPGEPEYYLRFGFTTARTGQTYNVLTQRIEGVRTLAGKRATLTFWAKTEEAPFALNCDLVQNFGTGGSPSAQVRLGAGSHNIGNAWQKFQAVIDIPSIAGKVIGSNGDDYLGLEIILPPNSTARLCLARVSLVEGDATAEADPFSPRHIQQEIALCQRYYVRMSDISLNFNATDVGGLGSWRIGFPTTMRATPTLGSRFVDGDYSSLVSLLWDNPTRYSARLLAEANAASNNKYFIMSGGDYIEASAEL